MNEYKEYFDKMLILCKGSILLKKPSEIITASEILEEYLTFFEYLLVIADDEDITIIQQILLHLLTLKTLERNEIDSEVCCKAMEETTLPITVVQLIQISSINIYQHLLELTLLMATSSALCCEHLYIY